MNFEFEGKKYATVSQIHRDWFPTRSSNWVRTYIKEGCKTVAEVVASSVKRESVARVQSIKNAKLSIFKSTNESVARSTKK